MPKAPKTSTTFKKLTLGQRVEIAGKAKNGVHQEDLARAYGVTQATISRTINKTSQDAELAMTQYNVKPSAVVRRAPKYELVEALLKKWFMAAREDKLLVSDAILVQKAEHYAKIAGYTEFKATSGFLYRFKNRHNIKSRKTPGEAGSVDAASVERLQTELQSQIAGYATSHVFNMDETGLFHKLMPDQTLSSARSERGAKRSKERVTAVVCSSADGVSMPLWVIGKSAKPLALRNVKQLPVVYRSSAKAWMTSELFKEYVVWFDGEVSRMFKEDDDKVLLLVDNCSSHKLPPGLQLRRVVVHFLPPNTTSVLQPCDAGIIRALKAAYKNKLMSAAADFYDQSRLDGSNFEYRAFFKKENLYSAIMRLSEAWRDVTPATIVNSWFHTKIVHRERPAAAASAPAEDNTELLALVEAAANHMGVPAMDADTFINDEQANPHPSIEDIEEDNIEQLQRAAEGKDDEEESDSDDDGDSIEVKAPTGQDLARLANSFKEGLSAMSFFSEFSDAERAMAASLSRKFQQIREAHAKQRTILSFFQPRA